jgi:hypothetical protein
MTGMYVRCMSGACIHVQVDAEGKEELWHEHKECLCVLLQTRIIALMGVDLGAKLVHLID